MHKDLVEGIGETLPIKADYLQKNANVIDIRLLGFNIIGTINEYLQNVERQ